jgi:hypothetical protein
MRFPYHATIRGTTLAWLDHVPIRPVRGGKNMLNNRFAREALKQAATQVNQGVRDGARQFVEREITPLRDRIDELEGRVARLERQIAELVRERDRTGR